MPSFVMLEKCDGCKGQDKTACMYICPVDLMTLNKEDMMVFQIPKIHSALNVF